MDTKLRVVFDNSPSEVSFFAKPYAEVNGDERNWSGYRVSQ